MEITFTNTLSFSIEQPRPASEFVPEWYKNTKSYVNNEKKPLGDGQIPSTIKRCVPVFDAITSGYIITVPVDIYVSIKTDENGNKGQSFEWPALEPLGFHVIEQAPEHPQAKPPYAYPKFNNPWAIKTPKGYSTLFVQPFHRESPFTIFPGIVDTDRYTTNVNFPFVINDPNFEGLLKQGTPMAQVIPIKRNSWNMKIGNEKNLLEHKESANRVALRFFDKYKYMFWDKKEYK